MFEMTIKEDTPQGLVQDKFSRVPGYVRVGWARSQVCSVLLARECAHV